MSAIRFGSVCSGIEAASVAWHPLGWRAAWLAEIEPFPAAVLAHHYPDVPNLGDMTQIAAKVMTGEVEAPDVLVGGTPCQAFSVAGMRKGLEDARGQLTIKYVELANAIDHVRRHRGEQPAIIVWENVPGVLSDKGNAFGCFLGALSGEDCELQPAGGGWKNAGCVFGPERTIAWRVLDAQYFGVAQRRRRVFLVASARTDIHPAQILFEFDGLRRDSAPRRESQEGFAGTLEASAARSRGAGTSPSICTEVAHSLRAQPQHSHRADSDNYVATFDRQSSGEYGTAPIGYDAYQHHGWRESDTVNTLTANLQRGVCGDSPLAISVHGTQDPDLNIEQAHTLGRNQGQENAVFAFAQNQRNEVRVMPYAGALAAETGAKQQTYIAQPAYGIPGNWIGRAPENGGNAVEPMVDVAPCQTVADRHGVAYSVALRGRDGGATAELGDDLQNCLRASQGGGDKAHVLTTAFSAKDYGGDASIELSPTLRAGNSDTSHANSGNWMAIQNEMAVRRLTPVECERLQGFPDGYTAIPWRNKPIDECPDGPRYKALGNSMAVPCMRFIGLRIAGLVVGL